jgi:radial spoke head protein 4A
MTYWVTSDLLYGEWKELPIVSPDQINASRRIKYIFTGDLDKTICTNPHFKGK